MVKHAGSYYTVGNVRIGFLQGAFGLMDRRRRASLFVYRCVGRLAVWQEGDMETFHQGVVSYWTPCQMVLGCCVCYRLCESRAFGVS